MPLSTLARTNLQYISGLTQVKNQDNKVEASAEEWLITLFHDWDLANGKSKDYKIFRIEESQLLGLLEVEPRPGFYRYSYDELQKNYDKFLKEYERVRAKLQADKKVDVYENAVHELGKHLNVFRKLAGAINVEVVPPEDDQDWQTMLQVIQKAAAKLTDEDVAEIDNIAASKLSDELQEKYGSKPEDIPEEVRPLIRQRYQETYLPEARLDYLMSHRERASPAAATFVRLINAANDGKGEQFDKLLSEYRNKYLNDVPENERWNVNVENYMLNHLEPFH